MRVPIERDLETAGERVASAETTPRSPGWPTVLSSVAVCFVIAVVIALVSILG
jgi:hypothetical protein